MICRIRILLILFAFLPYLSADDFQDCSLQIPHGFVYDQQGRPVLDLGGRRVQYTREGTPFLPDYEGIAPDLEGVPPLDGKGRAWLIESEAAFSGALDDYMREDHIIGSFNQYLGTAGILVLDVDRNGSDEILVAHLMMWYLLHRDPDTSSYVQKYYYDFGPLALKAGDVDGDGRIEVVCLSSAGIISLYDAADGRYLGEQNLGVASPLDFTVASVDGTPEAEIVVVTSSQVLVFRYGTVAPLWTVSGAGGGDVTVGNMDGDACAEIATSFGKVVDACTQAIQWTYGSMFGSYIDAGDIDGDGMDELAGALEWGNAQAFNVDEQQIIWAFDNFNTSAIRVADVTGDGIKEVCLGDAQWGDVHCHDGTTGGQVFSIPNPEHSVSNLGVGDPNGNCSPDIVWGAGYSSTGSDHLHVADISLGVCQWENILSDSPKHCFGIGDADGDGRTEVVRAGNASSVERVWITDLQHRVDEYTPSALTSEAGMVMQSYEGAMVLAQLDGDPQLEYVMADGAYSYGMFSALDSSTHVRQWTSPVFDLETLYVLAGGDLQKDGNLEILAGMGGTYGSFIRVFRGTDGSLRWMSAPLGGTSGVKDLRVADFDGDGDVEFLGVVSGVGLAAYSGSTYAQDWQLALSTINCLEVGDVDGDADPDVLLGTTGGLLYGYDGASHSLLFQKSMGSNSIYALRLGDVHGSGHMEIALTQSAASGSYLKLLNAADRSLLWTSPALPGSAGVSSSLYIQDADDDSIPEIAVSTSRSLRFYEVTPAVPDGAPPLFDGDVGVQSVEAMGQIPCCPSLTLYWDHAYDALSPPVTYSIYRSTDPGFIPGPSNFLAMTHLAAYRDPTPVAGTLYYYVVRASDRLWQEDPNLVRLSAYPDSRPPEDSPASSPQPLWMQKEGAALRLMFEDLGTLALSYNVYQGTVGNWYSHTALACGVPTTIQDGARTTTVSPGAGSKYFLVTASGSCDEGISGQDSQGIPHPDGYLTCPP
jgi:hypothetical protein